MMTRYSEHFATKEDFDLAQAKGDAFWESAIGRALQKAKDALKGAESDYNLAKETLQQAEEDVAETRAELLAAQTTYEVLYQEYGDDVPEWVPDLGMGIGGYL